MGATASLAQPPDFLKLLAHELRWQLLKALAESDRCGRELAALLNRPQNLISYHLKQLREQQLVTEHRSAADGRDVYYRLDLDHLRHLYFASGGALHPLLAGLASDTETGNQSAVARPARVLFLCTENSARSQMAEALLRQMGGKRVEAFSAGSHPTRVHPFAVQVMAAHGIDISRQRAKHLAEFAGQSFDYVITVCDRVRETCPVFPDDPVRIHWSFPDPAATEGPAAEVQRAFEETARQLTTRLHHLLIVIDRTRREAP